MGPQWPIVIRPTFCYLPSHVGTLQLSSQFQITPEWENANEFLRLLPSPAAFQTEFSEPCWGNWVGGLLAIPKLEKQEKHKQRQNRGKGRGRSRSRRNVNLLRTVYTIPHRGNIIDLASPPSRNPQRKSNTQEPDPYRYSVLVQDCKG
jgi:hypothetical protein